MTPGALVAAAGRSACTSASTPTRREAGRGRGRALFAGRRSRWRAGPVAAGGRRNAGRRLRGSLRAASAGALDQPGTLRLDLISRDDRDAKLLTRARIRVYAQHRLPPGVTPAGDYGARADDPAGVPPDRGGRDRRRLEHFPPARSTGILPRARKASRPGLTPRSTRPTPLARSQPSTRARSAPTRPPSSPSPGSRPAASRPRAAVGALLEGAGLASLGLCCHHALAADRDGNFWYASLTLGARATS